jgi:heterodisulfide reductase subunit A-like polyferredoxin/coenzyme F420-reducing hydrogenase delta subunit
MLSQPLVNSLPGRQSPAPRAGVFVCECGHAISAILDLETVIEGTRRLPGVLYAGRTPYWCSPDGRDRLSDIVRSEGLDRVIVAGCSPRTHRRLFQESGAMAGLDPSLVSVVNLREGCAWPHREQPTAATRRAYDQIAMQVAHTNSLQPHAPLQAHIHPTALVIGSGVAGMTAALELADAGVAVTLVERASTLGGMALTDHPPLAAELAGAIQSHSNLTWHLNSRIIRVDGSVGAYQVVIASTTQAEGEDTQCAVRHTFGAIVLATGLPDQDTGELARLLRLPQDSQGHVPELRVRLRPGHYLERGIYVCGSVHYPCDVDEAEFQACSAASRALRHLRRRTVIARGPIAQVDPGTCNGCGDCFRACPFAAVSLVERGQGPQPVAGLSLALIDALLCTGCGNCLSVCPVGAVSLEGWTNLQLEAQMQTALSDAAADGEARSLIFACEWSGYVAAELAGAQKLAYPPNVRIIRLDCAGRLQPGLILKAFELGAAGVLLLGCAPQVCHYERGNEQAAAAYEQLEALTSLLGLSRARLQLAWVSPDDGPAFATLVTRFVREVEHSLKHSRPRNTQYAPRSTQYAPRSKESHD